MKILLIFPPWYRLLGSAFELVPMGPAYLAALLRENGHHALIHNADYAKGISLPISVTRLTSHFDSYKRILADLNHQIWRQIRETVHKHSPDLVGVSVMTPKYRSALNIAKIVKEIDASIPVVFGGPHPTILPERTLREEVVDIVVRGEGEYTFLELVNSIESGSDLSKVLGISYKRSEKIVHNPERPLIKNLDELPFPARGLLINKEIYPSDAFGSLLSSRGCPYRCIFCESHKIWTRKVRFRSAENVVAEIQEAQKDFGTRRFDFEDDTFTIDRRRVMKFCELVKQEKLDIVWSCTTRADLVDDDMLATMKKAGCWSISIGAESGSEETQRMIKKGITLDQIKAASRLIKKRGIVLSAYWMVGFPWETLEDVERTMAFMKELDADFNIYSIVTPYPGSELYEMVLKEGLIKEDVEYDGFFHQSPEMMLCPSLTIEERRRLIAKTEMFVDTLNKEKAREVARQKLKFMRLVRLLIQKKHYRRPGIAMRGLLALLREALG